MSASLPISIVDLVVIGVIIISALLASVRGFTREVLAIVAWVIAGIVAYLFHPLLLPKIKDHFSNPTVAILISIGIIFIVVLLFVSIITVKISDFILDSRIGALDRTLGFIFGAGRGFLICVIGWIILIRLFQGGQIPEWAATARSRPFLDQSSVAILSALPDSEALLAPIQKMLSIDKPAAPNPNPPAPPAR